MLTQVGEVVVEVRGRHRELLRIGAQLGDAVVEQDRDAAQSPGGQPAARDCAAAA
ncbi:MAG: hypothetical protein U0S48_06655 [Solirubrobacteraceae bacterium]